MLKTLRTSFLLALMVSSYVGSAAATDSASVDPGPVAHARGFAARTLDRVPESGALLLWGVGLAAASRALARKRSDSAR